MNIGIDDDRKFILIIVNAVIYSAEIVVLSLTFWKDETTYHRVQSAFLNILYISSIVAFILYGFGLFRTWRNTPIARKSQVNIRRMRLTLIITVAVTLSFSIRVIVNALWTFIRNKSWHYPFEVGFYTIVEVAPIALLLWLMLASGFRRTIKDQPAFKPLIAQADYAYTDEEIDGYNSTNDEEEEEDDDVDDTPGGIFD
jgi:magnesium-transporting ATPase (P-type)